MDYYKVLSIVSPFGSALMAGFLTYYFTLRTKRFDILYQNKIAAFKEITSKLIEFKKFCIGRISFFNGNEYSPYYEENGRTLYYRTEIANIKDLNSVFISNSSQNKIENLLNELSILCNAEVAIVSQEEWPHVDKEYERVLGLTENCIVILYDELNLKL